MPRFECEREDIPKKWAVLDLIPGEADTWLLLQSNGIVDPAGNEVVINHPAAEAKGSFKEVSEAQDKRVKELEAMGYHLIQNKSDENPIQL